MPQSATVGDSCLGSEIVSSSDPPFYEEVLDWVTAKFRQVGLPRPLCKRLAIIISGLVASQKATIGDLSSAVKGLEVSKAKDESIARRLQRILRDARLDPALLPLIFRPLLPELLRSHLLAHAANASVPACHHQRFTGVVIILDESTQEDRVHLAVVGVPIGALVVPLAVRTWRQNVSLPEGEYWTQIIGMLQEVQEMLPPELRAHVLLVADRLYGVPRMLNILLALGWHWLLRVQGQSQVLMRDGTCKPLRALVPRPGTQWMGGFSEGVPSTEPESEILGVFKGAGWHRSQVVAVWAEEETEPWLLLTSLAATPQRVAEYAQRWAIERLFLSWKSHGWDLESLQMSSPQRLARYLSALALATIWTLVCGVTHVTTRIQARLSRCPQPTNHCVQPRLPGFDLPTTDHRSLFAKHSLISWGRHILHHAYCQLFTPPMHWLLPDWQAPTWSTHSQLLLAHHPL
jgi:hypothetical protein